MLGRRRMRDLRKTYRFVLVGLKQVERVPIPCALSARAALHPHSRFVSYVKSPRNTAGFNALAWPLPGKVIELRVNMDPNEPLSSDSSPNMTKDNISKTEANRRAAEYSRAVAENSRASAEAKRERAERKRAAAEDSRHSGEVDRLIAEEQRRSAEKLRQAAKETHSAAE